MFKNINKYCVIIGISIIISVILEILASRLSAPYITDFIKTQEDINSNILAGKIYQTWHIISQIVLYTGIGIAFIKHFIAPLALGISVVKTAKVVDLYFGDTAHYNFNEAFFFVNIFCWIIYTTFTWKFKNFQKWYSLCIAIHFVLCQLFFIFKHYI